MSEHQLALHGGPPTIPEGPPSWPRTTREIENSVSEALSDGSWGKYESRWTQNLIEKLAAQFQSEHVVLCSSGTIAVELALRGVGVRADDEVILAGYDFPGNFRAIEEIGALPVLVDVIQDGWIIDPTAVSDSISKKTKAIVVSHLHGQIADIAAIRAALEGTTIAIVEDACQSPGGFVEAEPLGSRGDVGVLSFGGSKLLSAGRGGAVLTNDADIFQRAKIFANRGNDAFPLSQLQAAALLPQLDELQSHTQRRHENVNRLVELTENLKRLMSLQQSVEREILPAYYKVPWLLANPTQGGWTRDEFIQAIQAEGIAIDSAFRGFTRRSPRRCRKNGSLVNSQIAAQQTVLLHHPVLLESAETIKKVALAIERVLAHDPV